MRALITGAAGLIGGHLVRALNGRGHNVRALVRGTSRRDLLAGPPVTWIEADLIDGNADLKSACAGCDVVFHTAAHFAYAGFTAEALRDTAVIGTERLLQGCAAARVERIVVTSSSVVFGYSDRTAQIDEGAVPMDADNEAPYVAAKIAQHRRALELGDRLRLDVRLACPTLTLGPTGSRLGPSNGLIVAYLADPFACTFPGGCNLVSARDVANGHILIAEHGGRGQSYLLGSQNMTWRQVHTSIAELAGVRPPLFELNHSLTYLAAAAEELRAAITRRAPLSTREQARMAGRYYWYSHSRAASLGYTPAPAHDALVETISWLAASPHVSRESRIKMRLSSDIYRFRAASAQEVVA